VTQGNEKEAELMVVYRISQVLWRTAIMNVVDVVSFLPHCNVMNVVSFASSYVTCKAAENTGGMFRQFWLRPREVTLIRHWLH
jgi:hypothetical protein